MVAVSMVAVSMVAVSMVAVSLAVGHEWQPLCRAPVDARYNTTRDKGPRPPPAGETFSDCRAEKPRPTRIASKRSITE